MKQPCKPIDLHQGSWVLKVTFLGDGRGCYRFSLGLGAAPADRADVDDAAAELDEVAPLGRKPQLGHVPDEGKRFID